jgi:hypothetical protein
MAAAAKALQSSTEQVVQGYSLDFSDPDDVAFFACIAARSSSIRLALDLSNRSGNVRCVRPLDVATLKRAISLICGCLVAATFWTHAWDCIACMMPCTHAIHRRQHQTLARSAGQLLACIEPIQMPGAVLPLE